MRRGEVWWAQLLPPVGRRPVVLVSRDKAIEVRGSVTVVPITRTTRGIATEVKLGTADGMPKACVANADVILTISKARLVRRLCALSDETMRALARAVTFALALDS